MNRRKGGKSSWLKRGWKLDEGKIEVFPIVVLLFWRAILALYTGHSRLVASWELPQLMHLGVEEHGEQCESVICDPQRRQEEGFLHLLALCPSLKQLKHWRIDTLFGEMGKMMPSYLM